MRSLIQYDLDESLPTSSPASSSSRRPPTKKRRRHNHHPQSHPPHKTHGIQHWDDPGSTAVGVVYDDLEPNPNPEPVVGDDYGMGVEEGEQEGEEEEEEEEESKELTHEEIWDDSALVDAWNSAEAEYEAYHGTSKAWKTEPVTKSPLWYNKPYTAKPSRPLPHPEPEDTAPLNFDTFIPTHDPSLGGVGSSDARPDPVTVTAAPFSVPPPSTTTTTTVSRDEAFNNALSAMYWSGYWTAVYHCHSQPNRENVNGSAETSGGGIEADEDENEEELVPAQR